MSVNAVQSAHIPDISNTRSTIRPLTNKETMQRANALCASRNSPATLPCTGQIFVGLFFDGTGNNEEKDYKEAKVNGKPEDQQHSNVVRLYHAYPDQVTRGTNKYYRYYVPGVGTSFPEIGDSGGPLGTGASWNGEPRLIWGLTRVFNAVHFFIYGSDLIPAEQAGRIANGVGGVGSTAQHREYVFKTYWSGKLRASIASKPKNRPMPQQINLSVFGFSRGAAEARAFVNWLYAICDEGNDGYQFAGIPLRVDFLGIFDTVASVGMAGAFTDGPLGAEGRQSWASDNMQVHKGVESCLHIVAAHEVRSTFPVDSVRIDGRYPPNVKEYVYPGAHSDVGGGYHRRAQGKTDALARVPGFEMYCAALAAGVPFLSLKQLTVEVRNNLIPSENAINIFQAYLSKAKINAGPIDEMMRQHMAFYFRYRYQGRNDLFNNACATSYVTRDFYRRAGAEREFLRDSQQHFIAILAMVSITLKYKMQNNSSFNDFLPQPFQKGNDLLKIAPVAYAGTVGISRAKVLIDYMDDGERDRHANRVREKLVQWQKWLNDTLSPRLMDADAPERDILRVIETLDDVPLDQEIVNFFDDWVHDSMAGLAKDKVNEFLLNGIGLAKFRRIYFGNNGDALTRESAKQSNERAMKWAKAQRAQRAKWQLESREYARMTGKNY